MKLDLGFQFGSVPVQNQLPAWAAGADLWYDFAYNRGLSPSLVDTHDQTIYESNAAGVFAPFGANVKVRSDLGLQTVPTRAELNSAPIPKTATWTKSNTTITDNAVVAPDGTQTAATIARTSTVASYTSIPPITKAASAVQYTMSVVAKAGTGAFLPMRLQGTYPARADVCFDLSLGTISSAASVFVTFASASATITSLGNGWYLCTLTATSDTGLSVVGLVSCLTVTGQVDATSASATANLTVWYMNMQAAAFAVPPILTGSATVNGNQQVIDLTGRLGTGVAGIFQFSLPTTDSGNTPVPFNIYVDVTQAERVLAFRDSNLHVIVTTGGVTVADLNLGAYTAGVNTFAFAASSGFFQARRVGNSAISSLTPAFPSLGAGKLAFGGLGVGTSQNSFQYAQKMALKFGAQDQTSFDAMYAKAVMASLV